MRNASRTYASRPVSRMHAARMRRLFPLVAGHKSASGKLSHSILVGTLTRLSLRRRAHRSRFTLLYSTTHNRHLSLTSGDS